MFKNFTQWLRTRLSDSDDLSVPVLFSLVIHVVLLLAFSISEWVHKERVLVKPQELQYIKTVVVNKQDKIAPKDQEAAKKVEDDRIKEIRRKQAEQQKLEEQKRIASKKAQEEADKKSREAEQKRIEELKKKELERQKAEQEAKKLAQQKAEEERKRQETLMKQKQEREQQLQHMREAREQQEALQKRREQLEQQRQAALAQQDAPVLNEHEGLIQHKISQNWSRPLSARNGMQVLLQIHLIPGGEVDNVKIIKSSGDEPFDDSAVQAVWKASPLPVPADAGVFTRNYRVFNLLFAPEDLWQ